MNGEIGVKKASRARAPPSGSRSRLGRSLLAAAELKRRALAASEGRRVLAVDDNAANRKLLDPPPGRLARYSPTGLLA